MEIFRHTQIRRIMHEDRPDTYFLTILGKDEHPVVARELSKERAYRLRPLIENLCREDIQRGISHLVGGAQESLVIRYK